MEAQAKRKDMHCIEGGERWWKRKRKDSVVTALEERKAVDAQAKGHCRHCLRGRERAVPSLP